MSIFSEAILRQVREDQWPSDATYKVEFTFLVYFQPRKIYEEYFDSAADAVKWIDMHNARSVRFKVTQIQEWDWGPRNIDLKKLRSTASMSD